jgi:hypothetical protein
MGLETILSNGARNVIGIRAYRNIMVDNSQVHGYR